MKKWTGRWLECRIHSFWSVHSKGQSWQLTQRPLQKNRSLTLTTVWGENVSGPEHCQNPPVAVCSYWSGMRGRNRELKTGRKKEGLREKETSELASVFSWSGARWVVLAGNIFPTKTAIEKAAQNTKTKSHDDKHNNFFLSIWMVFPLWPTGQNWTQNLQWIYSQSQFDKRKMQQRIFLCSETFINHFEMCHFYGYDCYRMCFMDMSIVALDENCVTYLLHKLQYISCI